MLPMTQTHPDIISRDEAGTLSGLLRCRASKSPDSGAFMQFERECGTWRTYTWQQVADRVKVWRQALSREQFAAGDRVALQLGNSLNWVCFDQAALSLGLVVVPLYTADSPENAAYILADSAARLLLLDSVAQLRALRSRCPEISSLQRVVVVQREEAYAHEGDIPVIFLHEWLTGKPFAEAGAEEAAEPEPENREADPDAPATIIYTSGTTGRPKGVMLSHHNILWNAETVLRAIPCYRDDLFLSFLPLSHSFERTIGYYLPIMAGSCVAYARSVQELAKDLVIIRPTVLISVPRIFERFYAKVQNRLAQQGIIPTLLFRWTVNIGWQRFEAAQGRGKTGLVQCVFWPALRRLVAGRILASLGGRLRIAVSGGAPLCENISRSFIGLGVQLLQGYGLTEAAPVVSANLPERNIPASVGPPLPGIEIRIGADDELLIRSPGVMAGYWGKPDDTKRVLDDDGWLHTGDQAEISGGHIFIRGRIKDIIVMSTGEKVSPAEMEMAILQDDLFDSAIIIGEGKPFLAALVVINQDNWKSVAEKMSLAAEAPASLRSTQVTAMVLEKITALLHDFPGQARVRAVCPMLKPWTIDGGLLTPTMKMRRTEIEKQFYLEIHELYAEHDVPNNLLKRR